MPLKEVFLDKSKAGIFPILEEKGLKIFMPKSAKCTILLPINLDEC
jgi:hypothetical protein